jgi:hypothetical protein
VSKFNCRCGEVISDVTCPSTHGGRLVTDIDADDFKMCTTDDGHRGGHVDLFSSRDFMECPFCFRLWVQLSRDSPTYIAFLPERQPLKLAEQQGGYRG